MVKSRYSYKPNARYGVFMFLLFVVHKLISYMASVCSRYSARCDWLSVGALFSRNDHLLITDYVKLKTLCCSNSF